MLELPVNTVPANTVVVGERDYQVALDLVIKNAQKSLYIFDQNLIKGDYASLNRYDALNKFLAASMQNRLMIVLNELDYFSTACPRLVGLLQRYSNAMTVYETNQHVKQLKDNFVLADDTCYIHRFHVDQARFKYDFDDAVTGSMLKMRFEELLQNTSQSVSFSTLGL